MVRTLDPDAIPAAINIRLRQYPEVGRIVAEYRAHRRETSGVEISWTQALADVVVHAAAVSPEAAAVASARDEAYRTWSKYVRTELAIKLEEIKNQVQETPTADFHNDENKEG